jgi:small-conductance mechanosensitive channel
MRLIGLLAATETDTAETLEQLGALTLSDWLWAGGLTLASLVAAFMAYRIVQRLAAAQLVPFVARLVARLVAIVVFIFGFFYAMQQVGVSLAPFLGVIGLLGLALAFAFQEVLENFIAGVFLSARRPFSQGDEISTAGHEGVIEDISLREVTMRTYDGERVFIPNASVWQNPIVNHTRLKVRRTTLAVGVAYASHLDSVAELLAETLADVEGVHDTPHPEAYAYEFADSSINFALRFWHDAGIADEWAVRDRVLRAVHAALNDAGIEIPFPQRVVDFIEGAAPQS